MLKFIAKRLLLVAPILLGVSIIVFLTSKLIPGDPVANLLGTDAPRSARIALTNRLGLNKPLPVQYGKWLWSVLHGNFGNSIALQTPVGPLLGKAFANTALLAVTALVVATVLGMILGGIAAFRPKSPGGLVTSAFSVFALSTPQYSAGLILLVVLAVNSHIFPAGGIHSSTGNGGLLDLANHLVLPTIAASLVSTGIVARMFRSSLMDVLGQDFVEGMRARGLGRAAIIRHAVHNTVPSLLTITGLQIGYLLGGVIFVERIFSWPGMGLLIFNAISARDYPVIQAAVLVVATSFVLINVVVDSAHAFIDPRVRQAQI